MKTLFASLAAGTLLLLMPFAAAAVTFGQPDGEAHPYVGTLLFQVESGAYYSCSGTLLSPTVVLTAAHCLIDRGKLNLNTWVTFQAIPDFSARANYGSLQEFLNDPANGWVQADPFPHPQYAGAFPNTYDIGVAKLRTAVTSPTYAELPTIGFLGTVRTAHDNRFTVVGYGMQGYIQPFYENRWERYVGNVRLVELKSTFNGNEASAKFTNNPGARTSGGSCFGDSGGPVFYGNSNIVVAVVSWGITPCIGVDYSFRTDTAVAQEFLRPFLQ